jgi:hypothetical protein
VVDFCFSFGILYTVVDFCFGSGGVTAVVSFGYVSCVSM